MVNPNFEQNLGHGPEVIAPVAAPNDVRGSERWLKRIALGATVITALSVAGLLGVKEQNPDLFRLGIAVVSIIDGALLGSFLANMGVAKTMGISLAEMMSRPLPDVGMHKYQAVLFAEANIFGSVLGMFGGGFLSTFIR